MSNKFHNKDSTPSQQSSKKGWTEQAGPGKVDQGKEGTANWPSVPGKTQGGRSGGTPSGKFHVKSEGI